MAVAMQTTCDSGFAEHTRRNDGVTWRVYCYGRGQAYSPLERETPHGRVM
jgi:hypothetical protein